MSGGKTYQTYPDYTRCDIEAGRIRGGDEPQNAAPVKSSPEYRRALEID
ncbi:MAG: hypothetical protein ACI4WS_04385 [Oscillospiraceae bacterium]